MEGRKLRKGGPSDHEIVKLGIVTEGARGNSVSLANIVFSLDFLQHARHFCRRSYLTHTHTHKTLFISTNY